MIMTMAMISTLVRYWGYWKCKSGPTAKCKYDFEKVANAVCAAKRRHFYLWRTVSVGFFVLKYAFAANSGDSYRRYGASKIKIEKWANLRLPLNAHKPKMLQLQGAPPPWPPDTGSQFCSKPPQFRGHPCFCKDNTNIWFLCVSQFLKSGQIYGFHWTPKTHKCFSFRGASPPGLLP